LASGQDEGGLFNYGARTRLDEADGLAVQAEPEADEDSLSVEPPPISSSSSSESDVDIDYEVSSEDEVNCDQIVGYFQNKSVIQRIETAMDLDFQLSITKAQFKLDINQYLHTFNQANAGLRGGCSALASAHGNPALNYEPVALRLQKSLSQTKNDKEDKQDKYNENQDLGGLFTLVQDR